MNQLVNMQVITMSSREIADLVGSRHDKVKQSMIRLASRVDDNGNPAPVIDLPPLGEYLDSMGRKATEYRINKRDSFVVVAQLSPEFTAALVDRWQELEAKAQDVKPLTHLETARLLVSSLEQIEQQAQQLAIAAPKVEFVDKYVESSGLKGFRQVAKLLRIKENLFRAFLSDQKIMYQISGEWVPYANHIDAGRFEVKTGASDGGHAFNQAKFTAKGVEYVSRLLRDSKKIEPEKAL